MFTSGVSSRRKGFVVFTLVLHSGVRTVCYFGGIPGGFMREKSHEEMMGKHYRERPAEAVAMFRALLLDGGELGEWCIFFRYVRRAFFSL